VNNRLKESRRPSVEKLFQNCPALANHLSTARLSLMGTDARMLLDELESFLAGKEQGAIQLTVELCDIRSELTKSKETVGRLLEYVRLLQVLITRIAEGRVTPPVRVAVQHIVDAWVTHRAALDLGQKPLRKVEEHIAAMQGTAAILFGISAEELRNQVYDVIDPKAPDRQDGDYSPFSGVGTYKY